MVDVFGVGRRREPRVLAGPNKVRRGGAREGRSGRGGRHAVVAAAAAGLGPCARPPAHHPACSATPALAPHSPCLYSCPWQEEELAEGQPTWMHLPPAYFDRVAASRTITGVVCSGRGSKDPQVCAPSDILICYSSDF